MPAPQEADEDVLFWNDADEDDGPEMEWVESGSAVAAAPMPHFTAGRRMFIQGEAGPWLGVVLSDLDSAEQAKGSKLAIENGVLVKNVREESPAAKAGLMKDDVIVEFAGEKVRSAAQLRRLVRETPPGRSVSIVVTRAGKNQTLTAKLETRHLGPMAMGGIQAGPGEFTIPLPPPPGSGGGRNFEFFVPRGARLGISGDDLTPQLAEFFGVKQGKGVLVREVIVGSSAEKGGLKAGDVVVAVDGQEIATVGKLRRALAGQKADTEKRKVTLTIVRDKREQTLTVELDSPDKFMPKPVMRTELEFDPDRAMEIADEAASRAKEIGLAWRDRAKTFQTEWQARMQEEKKRLKKELPRLQEELQKEVHGAMAELERI
jgi:membrane-associated protease RseP (regulator of RpoE activity)